jgi:hypothetical protein
VTRARIEMVIAIVVLGAIAWVVPQVRRDFIKSVITYDAAPTEPAPLPTGTGPGLVAIPRTRVILVDGLDEQIARTLPAWGAVCKRGLTMTIDVGFPTVSLPVEAALWSGLTQQQSGIVYRSGVPLIPPLDRRGIPAQVPMATAVAEYYGWIVRSLGFAITEPAAAPNNPAKDLDPEGWKKRWEVQALAAVQGAAPLVFVHILRVDTAGHKFGMGGLYNQAAIESDAILGRLVAADPAARWFLLSDHGHVGPGGHGGEERHIRQVQGCIAGPGVAAGTSGLVHLVDISRAIADSTGAVLPAESRGRPLSVAVASPLGADQAIPPIALADGVLAIFVLVVGLALSGLTVRRWWLAPLWFVIACATLLVVRGVPTLSTGMIYKPEGRDMYLTWLAALPLATVCTYLGLGKTTLLRVLLALLALPFAVTCAALTASGAWPTIFGAELAPVVPRYTAWSSPLLLIAAHGAAAVALGVLARLVRPVFDRFGRRAPPQTAPSAAE